MLFNLLKTINTNVAVQHIISPHLHPHIIVLFGHFSSTIITLKDCDAVCYRSQFSKQKGGC